MSICAERSIVTHQGVSACVRAMCVREVIGLSHLRHGMVFEVVILHSVVHTKIHEIHEKQWFTEAHPASKLLHPALQEPPHTEMKMLIIGPLQRGHFCTKLNSEVSSEVYKYCKMTMYYSLGFAYLKVAILQLQLQQEQKEPLQEIMH